MSAAKLRLMREFADQERACHAAGIFRVHGLVDDNVFLWEIFVAGPPGTLYEGGLYRAVLRFPPEYPMQPPSMQFKSTILHPNVYRDGKVCITTLQVMAPDCPPEDSSLFWRPILGIDQVVLSVISLLSDPNPSDPANLKAAALFMQNHDQFKAECRANAARSIAELPADLKMPKTAAAVNPQGVDADHDDCQTRSAGSGAAGAASSGNAAAPQPLTAASAQRDAGASATRRGEARGSGVLIDDSSLAVAASDSGKADSRPVEGEPQRGPVVAHDSDVEFNCGSDVDDDDDDDDDWGDEVYSEDELELCEVHAANSQEA